MKHVQNTVTRLLIPAGCRPHHSVFVPDLTHITTIDSAPLIGLRHEPNPCQLKFLPPTCGSIIASLHLRFVYFLTTINAMFIAVPFRKHIFIRKVSCLRGWNGKKKGWEKVERVVFMRRTSLTRINGMHVLREQIRPGRINWWTCVQFPKYCFACTMIGFNY